MNLAELHRRQQVSVGMAAAAATPEARSSHRQLASGYAIRIKDFDASAEERFSANRVIGQVAGRRADLTAHSSNEDAAEAPLTA